MKGLRLYIPPFAPDDSGAAAVFNDLNAMTVIIDAGGCAGNILGFDEPRKPNGAVFSAGLRDMDAILGRDENLIEKITSACKSFSPELVALIGTPVPAVIGTDYSALCRIIEKKLNIPALAVDTDGTKLYDEGISKAYLALFKKFAKKSSAKKNILGVLGINHFDFIQNTDWNKLKNYFNEYDDFFMYGNTLETFKRAGEVKKNIVLSASGLKAAKYLEKNFDIPYQINYPFPKVDNEKINESNFINLKSPKILIIHEQFHANALREEMKKVCKNVNITVGTWFMSHKEYCEENDVCFTDEEDFIKFVKEGNFNAIFGDKLFLRALTFYDGDFVHLHHFAVSGA